MSRLAFERPHALGEEEAIEVTRRLARTMADDYGVSSEWQGNTLAFRRSGVRGTLEVYADRIVLDAKLGPLLAAFAPRIRDRLEHNFAAWYGD